MLLILLLPGNCSRYGSVPTLERDRNGWEGEKATSIKTCGPDATSICEIPRPIQCTCKITQSRWDRMHFDQWNVCFHSKPRGHPTCLLPETFSPCRLRWHRIRARMQTQSSDSLARVSSGGHLLLLDRSEWPATSLLCCPILMPVGNCLRPHPLVQANRVEPPVARALRATMRQGGFVVNAHRVDMTSPGLDPLGKP